MYISLFLLGCIALLAASERLPEGLKNDNSDDLI